MSDAIDRVIGKVLDANSCPPHDFQLQKRLFHRRSLPGWFTDVVGSYTLIYLCPKCGESKTIKTAEETL